MRMSRNALFALALTAGFAVLGTDAFAQVGDAANAGSGLVSTIQSAITGNIGLLIGLVLAVVGIWTWVVKQETAAGIMLIIGGVLITITPGVFNTLGNFVKPLVGAASGDNINARTGAQAPQGL